MSDAALVDRELDREERSGAVDDRALSVRAPRVPQARGLPSWWTQATEQLRAMRSLGENWDGYGAAAPRAEILHSAIGFLRFLSRYVSVPLPYMSPTRNGGVLFEWERGPHQLEVDICTRDAASYVYLNRQTDLSISGYLFKDSADDGCFLEVVRTYFATE